MSEGSGYRGPTREEALELARRIVAGERLTPMMASVSIGMLARALVAESDARRRAEEVIAAELGYNDIPF